MILNLAIEYQNEPIMGFFFNKEVLCLCSAISNCLQPHGLCSPPGTSVHGIFPGKNTEVSCYFLLQGIFLTQGSNPHLLHLLHWQKDSLPLCPLGNKKRHINPGEMITSGVLIMASKHHFLLKLGVLVEIVYIYAGIEYLEDESEIKSHSKAKTTASFCK